jgi:hypothetical protein
MNIFDSNQDSALSKSELSSGFATISDRIRDSINSSHQAFIDAAFASHDSNSDDTLSAEELAEVGQNFARKFIQGEKSEFVPESAEET